MIIRLIILAGILISQGVLSQDKDLNLPSLGDRVSGVISLEQEKLLGQSFVEQVYAQAPLIMILLFRNIQSYLSTDFLNHPKLTIEISLLS